MIDIAVNLTDSMFQGVYRGKPKHEGDLGAVLSRALGAGVEKIMVTGTDVDESRNAVAMASSGPEESPLLYATVGVHPTRAGEVVGLGEEGIQAVLRAIVDDAEDGVVVAVGETGMDYNRTQYAKIEDQELVFDAQLGLAAQLDLPLFLHYRNDDHVDSAFARILRNRIDAGANLRGVVHSFTGTVAEAQEILDLGLFIGINGCSLKSVVRNVHDHRDHHDHTITTITRSPPSPPSPRHTRIIIHTIITHTYTIITHTYTYAHAHH